MRQIAWKLGLRVERREGRRKQGDNAATHSIAVAITADVVAHDWTLPLLLPGEPPLSKIPPLLLIVSTCIPSTDVSISQELGSKLKHLLVGAWSFALSPVIGSSASAACGAKGAGTRAEGEP